MENLKITINLSSPILIDRFSTIDAILLNLYIKRNFKTTKYPRDKMDSFNFIDKYKDGYCGSIWFVEKDELVLLENKSITKKPEYNYLNENRSRPKKYTVGSGEFKSYSLFYEVQRIGSLYFYVRGDKSVIEDLLKDLSYLGKKASIGLGKVSSFKVEIVDEDKSVFLSKNNPSRPVSVKNYTLDNNRIGFFCSKAPYWDKTMFEACYMPNNTLYESEYVKSKYTPCKNKDFVSAVKFTYDILHNDTKNWAERDVKKFMKKKDTYVSNNTEHRCIFSSEIAKEGVIAKNITKNIGDSFTDYDSLMRSSFMSKEGFWCWKNGVARGNPKTVLGFHIVDENGIFFVMGKNKTMSIIDGLNKAKVPFSIALKSTEKAQHVVFKSKVTLSKELICCQQGDNTFYFSLDDAIECKKEAEMLCKKYDFAISSLLPNTKIEKPFTMFKKILNNEEHYKIASDFYKKYDHNVRGGAYLIGVGV